MADPVFKRIFGEEKDIMISLINATIELQNPVVEIEYLQPELPGEHTDEKTSIVDVRCKDAGNRHFIVEMQISQHKAFKQRMLFNACKVYSRQLPVGGSYQDLQAVHCLSILNNVVEPDTEHFIHTYDISNKKGHLLDLEGIHLHCIELPKFRKNSKFDMTNPLHAWMKFFADPEYFSTMPIRQYETFEELKKAIELADESNFSQGQLYAYDKYLDNIRTQKAIEDYQKEMGIEMGIEIGRKEGVNITISIYKDLQRGILSYEDIAKKYAISLEEVKNLAAEFK
ncbi:MAG: hypothetical protein RLZZ557_303 [Bacteroidota bacterium]